MSTELEQAREELDRFFSLSLDLLCIASADGRFRRLNPAWHVVLGWTDEELRAVPYLDFVHPDDRAATVAAAAQLAVGATVVNFENRYRCKDGTYRWLNWRAAPGPEHGLVYAAARDVTDQKHAAHELELKASALAAAQRDAERANRAKSEFVSRMSHDLRTPLNAILGFAQLLAGEDLDAERLEYVRQILSGGRHLLELINEVLDIARIEAGQLSLSPEPVNVAEIVKQVLELVAPLAAHRRITLEIADDGRHASSVRADRQRLAQILLNLVSNAVKYNRIGGGVVVQCAVRPERRLRITVADTGAGIPPEKLRLLFTPFERLGAEQTETQGTGLGLALSQGLAHAMGGTMGVESEMDRGSRFWVELALSDEPAARRDSPPVARASHDHGVAGTILYIEDNVSNVRLMERIFKRRPGVTLFHASGGSAGVALAQQLRPTGIFLDLHLPDMSGEEVLRQLWEDPELRSIPVAVLTADATSTQKRRLKASGAAAYLTKPLDIGEVVRLIDEFLTSDARSTPRGDEGR